ncbi:hypothetical protein [Stappia sp. ICDLI1TA098]
MNLAFISSKVWSFCNLLKDDGVGSGDYLEQLIHLPFSKMADEYSKPPHSRSTGVPEEYNSESLRRKRGAELEAHCVVLLCEVETQQGIWDQIFTKAQKKIQAPAKLHRLVSIDVGPVLGSPRAGTSGVSGSWG